MPPTNRTQNQNSGRDRTTMFDIFDQIKTLIRSSKVCIDNNAFVLHYRLTVVILVIFSLVIGSRKYFGDPIDCTTVAETERVVDNYCWFNLYIIVPRHPHQKYGGDRHPHRPVIDNAIKSLDKLASHPEYKARFLYAYQWIEFILFLQAVLFFIPRYLWRHCWERGRVKTITENFSLVSMKQEEDKQRTIDIVRYFKRSRYEHFEYVAKYIICEVLNFANVLTQYLMLRNTFGLDMETLLKDFFSSESNSNLESPVNSVFPNMARCEIPVPRGGTTVLNQEYCVLPVNVFTTKIYIFLWFYFLLLATISAAALLYRGATIFSPKFRWFILKRIGRTDDEDCAKAVKHLTYGDWFLLTLVGENMDPFSFGFLIKQYNDDTVTSRPSLAFIGSEKLYNPDLAQMQIRKESEGEKTTPRL